MPDHPIIPCQATEGWREVVERYAEALKEAAFSVGDHGMTPEAFEASGLFKSAVERLRGQQAATLTTKQRFIGSVLDHLKDEGYVSRFQFVGLSERHDYEVFFKGGRLCCIEAKGCLDGNNTNIFERPPNADEFLIWSLCQNPGADPRHNAWSGIQSRLSAEIISRRQRVDGLIIWDMLCGTLARPCPKLQADASRATMIDGKALPPPCLYLFPRTIPDARNNPKPRVWELRDLRFMEALSSAFGVQEREVCHVGIEARMDGADVQRKTVYTVADRKIHESNWTTIRRAR